MSFAIDLKEYGRELSKLHEGVISSDPETTWAIFAYDGAGNALKPLEHGSGDLDEFIEAFDDSQIEYGLVRVEFNGINKIVLVGYCGENVSGRKRLVFNSHMSSVAKQFNGHHIQFTALSADDLTPKTIMDRVSSAAGSKYVGSAKPAPPTKPKYVKVNEGANEDDWGDSAAVEERELSHGAKGDYQSSARDELLAFRKQGSTPAKKAPVVKTQASQPDTEEEQDVEPEQVKSDTKPSVSKGISGLNSGTSYQPVGKIDLKAIRAEAKGSKFADSRIEKIEPSYKPVGKVDIKAIREQARKEKQLKLERESKGTSTSSSTKTDEEPPVEAKKSVEKAPVTKQDTVEEPTKKPLKTERSTNDFDNESSISKYELSNNASESEYQAPDRRSEYGVRKTATRKSATQEDDETPQFSSLAERMKAFQQSVSGAKPQFDTKSTRSSEQTVPKSTPSRSEASEAKSSASGNKPYETADDEDEEGPVSVAAQLAKARLSAKKDSTPDQTELKSAREASYGIKKENAAEREAVKPSTETPRAAVSTFAARFAKKTESTEPEETKLPAKSAPVETPKQKEEPPAPPRRVAAPSAEDDEEKNEAPPAPSRPAPEPAAPPAPTRRAIPEPEEEAEEEEEENITAVVIQKYKKDDDDEIALDLNETITDIQKVDENWWIGKNSHGDVGLFPADYVKVGDVPAEPKRVPASTAPVAPAPVPEAAEPEDADDKEQIAIALYTHDPTPEDDDELRFEKGEKIVILDFTSDDWFTGKNTKDEVGLVAATYVELK